MPIFMCKTEVQTFCFFTGGKQEEKKATYEMYVLKFGITFYIKTDCYCCIMCNVH